jgi:hypothetical protein
MNDFKNIPNSKKLYLLNYYDISKEDVYAFLLDMCQSRDWLFAMSILMNGNVSHYFSMSEHFDKKAFEHMMELSKDHELTHAMLKSYYDANQAVAEASS